MRERMLGKDVKDQLSDKDDPEAIGYRIFDDQLAEFKEGLPVFKTESEAYDYYYDTLYEQCLDGNCGYGDEYSQEEIIADLKEKTKEDLFNMFHYSVLKIIFEPTVVRVREPLEETENYWSKKGSILKGYVHNSNDSIVKIVVEKEEYLSFPADLFDVLNIKDKQSKFAKEVAELDRLIKIESQHGLSEEKKKEVANLIRLLFDQDVFVPIKSSGATAKALTIEDLIAFFKEQPKSAKILIEDSDGGSSDFLTKEDLTDVWEREAYDDDGKVKGTEHVIMFSKYKER